MTTTAHERPRGFGTHLWTWVQAVGLVYLIGFAMVLFGAAVALGIRGVIELIALIAGLMR